ncbi:sugar phosphate nucleotidyltransferase [Acidianus brierleyi]|uniref:UTP--glucose-1-phosphate uridylyltransferase n=1 Tax=Acidianus brierleyi TaxID=41673 RepID=A0A2U9ID50_9CREN|nr:sugar phosphate nucleotidyltransferase [Acidianus brierleyi]AWR93951.1 UTP--glucose-1-phosphate uridylyltransferase [Acidianus brierleyi]
MHAVITAAGLGTRMLPASKEIPKEMFPIPFQGNFKPVIQIIFEQLFDSGIRDFVIVVGKGKRVIEDHFTPDYDFISYLEDKGKTKQAEDLRSFYQKIEGSNIAFVNQSEPRGFGDAVLRAEPFVEEDFILVAADTILGKIPLEKMKINSFLTTEVEDPRPYGVVVVEGEKVLDVEEKPAYPKSNLIIVPYYHFNEEIFPALREIKWEGELQLTDGIKYLMRKGREFRAIKVNDVYDLGNVENYITSLRKILM